MYVGSSRQLPDRGGTEGAGATHPGRGGFDGAGGGHASDILRAAVPGTPPLESHGHGPALSREGPIQESLIIRSKFEGSHNTTSIQRP